jgi:ABC-2 type transport system permease protein
MRKFVGFVKKEFRHLLRDYRSLIILIGMPFAQVLIFGFAISTDLHNIPVAFHDCSHDVETMRLTNKILASGYFINTGNSANNNNNIEEIFRKGKVKLVVSFGPDFAKKLYSGEAVDIRLISDASDANTAHLITNYALSIIQDYQQELNKEQLPSHHIIPEIKMLYNPNMVSAYMFVPGIICLLLMLISAIMTSISIVREKELGTMEILLASPLRPIQIIIGKVIPYVLVSFVIGIIILTLGYTVFKIPVNSNLALLLLEFLLFITLALSLGILISTITNSQQVALMIAMFALLLPVLLLSGFIYPIENMPKLLQYITIIMPPRWFIIIVKNIMLKGVGIEHVWKETLILSGMTIFLLTLSIRKFKTRLSQ